MPADMNVIIRRMNHLKTPVYMVVAGLVIVFLVAILSSTCGLFGIDLVPGGSMVRPEIYLFLRLSTSTLV